MKRIFAPALITQFVTRSTAKAVGFWGKKVLLSTPLAERTNKPPSKPTKVWASRLEMYRVLEALLLPVVHELYIRHGHIGGVHAIADTKNRSARASASLVENSFPLPFKTPPGGRFPS